MVKGDSIAGACSCWVLAALFVAGMLQLWLQLKEVQVEDAAEYNYASMRQSIRRVQIGGVRGRILDCHGRVLGGNRQSLSIVCLPSVFQRKTWEGTVSNIEAAVIFAGDIIGRKATLKRDTIARHVRRSLAMPLLVWRGIDNVELARFSEHEREMPGFAIEESVDRVYPEGFLAAHVIGYVGRDRGAMESGDEKFNFFSMEMRGRDGLELYYDDFLKGVAGERKVLVDARGFAIRDWTVTQPLAGLDLRLTLDVGIQRAVERELDGCVGACVVIDPRNGGVLALASAPAYDLNDFVPFLSHEEYDKHLKDPRKPLFNRATGGKYAPGSTFKPVTAMSALSLGYPAEVKYCCKGVFEYATMRLHCASRWGHGDLDLRHALMKSCNPFFCNLALETGTNAIIAAAAAFGLGKKTGIDLGVDVAGTIPNGDWKFYRRGEKWVVGDLVHMAIGQGMLEVSPLQMALLAGAIGTGYRVVPHLWIDAPTERIPLPFAAEQLAVVREGMRMVVAGDGESSGSGRRGGEGVSVSVSGKTGTAEVDENGKRHKNAWFIAYAPSEQPTVAIAMVIENGESGGATAAPRVRNVLAHIFGERSEVARR